MKSYRGTQKMSRDIFSTLYTQYKMINGREFRHGLYKIGLVKGV